MTVTCASFGGGLVTDLMEDALDETMVRAIDAHLASCPACRELYWRMGLVVGLLGRLGARC